MSTQSTSTAPLSGEVRTIPVDSEHVGIRLAIPLVTLGAIGIIYAFLNAFLSNVAADGSLSCLALLLAIFAGLAVAGVTDGLLKRYWPSQRHLQIDLQGLSLNDQRRGKKALTRLVFAQRINLLAWRFTVKRGSARVPKGWIMLGCQLIQDEEQMLLYTFAPVAEADADRYEHFEQLVLREVLNSGQMSVREANQQRRLLRAEDERWMDGAELNRQDFARVIDTLHTYQPNWQDQS